jgi:cyclopropane-fatty-acyl-phospholipid synthase
MDVLDLGCGWGSLSLWIASHYPNCSVTSVSNSAAQRRFIEAEAKARGLDNIRVITADMNDFDIDDRFDRAVSVEMFEHMRNYGVLFGRISGWLRPGGQFFMHIFCHRSTPYAFVDNGRGDWMSRHFFSGGIMPSADLPLRFQRDLHLDQQWTWDGRHYQKTANAWLESLDARRDETRAVLAPVYGEAAVQQWVQRWRIFFMACAELFGLRQGQEWMVSHYRFSRQKDRQGQ